MNKQYVEKLARKYNLEITYTGDHIATFTLMNQVSDSVQLQVYDDNPNPTVIINGQDIARTQREYSFSDIREAIKALSVFSDYYNLVIAENFKQF